MTRTARRWRIAASAGLSSFLVLAGTFTASAVWSTPASSLPASAAAATVSATLSPSTSSELSVAALKYTGAPSPDRIGLLTYVNTGSAPVAVTLGVTGNTGTLAGQVAVALWTPAGTTCPTSIPASGTVTGTLAAPPATLPTAFASVAPGATVRLCVGTRITAALSSTQGSSVTPTFTLTGRVGVNWTTVASTAFSQSVWRVGAPANAQGVIDCVNQASNASVNLSWRQVQDATSYSVIFLNGATTHTVTVPAGTGAVGTTVTGNVTAAQLGYTLVGSGTITVNVVSNNATYGSVSTATARTLNLTSLLNLGLVPGLGCPPA